MLPSAPPAPRIAQSRKFLNWQRWRFVLKNSATAPDRKSTRLNSSHGYISYAVFCLKKKNHNDDHGFPHRDVNCAIDVDTPVDQYADIDRDPLKSCIGVHLYAPLVPFAKCILHAVGR